MSEAIPIPRIESETAKAYNALCEYCAMGEKRSLRKLADGGLSGGKPGAKKRRLTTLERWSSQHDWQARAAAYDQAVREKARVKVEEELITGLALPGERVRVLKELAAELLDKDGQGMRHVVVRNGNGLLAQLRGLLDDLAKETGGRVQKSERRLTDKDGNDRPLTVELDAASLDKLVETYTEIGK